MVIKVTGIEDTAKIVHIQAERLREKSYLVPAGLRDFWLNYLNHKLNHYVSIISRLPPPDTCGPLLEIGCVPGHLTIILSQMGYKLTCVDIDPERFSELWKAYDIKVHRVNVETEPLPFADENFSVVLFTEILEHLRIQPIFAIRQIFRVTKAGGGIILSIPNITPRDRWRFLFGRDYQGNIIKEFEKLEKVGHMGHIRLYSAAEVQSILKYAGYTEIKYICEGRVKGKGLWRLVAPLSDSFRSHLYFTAKRSQ
jgi:SAM-dependent methyltransferase